MDELRDYVAEAAAILRRGDPMSGLDARATPLQELIAQNRSKAIQLLIQLLQNGNGTYRKNAAFALGQIGDPTAIQSLVEQKAKESARGNIEAIDAALVTLRTIPLSTSTSDIDRRRMVDNVYEGRPPGWTPDSSSTATAGAGATSNEPKRAGGCFVATAACGDPCAPEVLVLSAFRDDVLLHHRLGRAFVRFYYTVSPPIAAVIAQSSMFRWIARALLIGPTVLLVGNLWNRHR